MKSLMLVVALSFLAHLYGMRKVGLLPGAMAYHSWWAPQGKNDPWSCTEVQIEDVAGRSDDDIVGFVQSKADQECKKLGDEVCPKGKAKFMQKGVYKGVSDGPCHVS